MCYYTLYMSQCIFCQIVKGKIPSYKIYENKEFLGFLDLAQIVDGHTLLIPKKHVRWIWQIDNPGGFFKAGQKIAKHFQQITGEEFVMSVSLGVMVEHAHWHLLPSTEGSVDKVVNAWVEAREARKLDTAKLKQIEKRFRLR